MKNFLFYSYLQITITERLSIILVNILNYLINIVTLVNKCKKMKKKKFVTIFLNYKNLHFYKDPGQVPFRFKKFGYKSYIVCYKNESDYSDTTKFLPLKIIHKIHFLGKYDLGIIFFILLNSLKIDILNLFHLNYHSLLIAFIYKMINPAGFVYLKMDNCHYSGTYPWEKIFNYGNKLMQIHYECMTKREKRQNKLIKNLFIQKIDMFSVEDKGSKEYFEKNYSFLKGKLITVYNGHTIDLNDNIKLKSFSQKRNIILTVGRLGTHQKATEILLEAFNLISKNCDWRLYLAGSIEPEFNKYISNYFEKNNELTVRVVFKGSLCRDELYMLYNQAKIFCLPSRDETFANVFSEAMYFKNAIITTPYVSPRDLINDYKMGLVVEKDDPKALAKALLKLISNEKLIKSFGENAHLFAKKELNWDGIITKLNNEIVKRKRQ